MRRALAAVVAMSAIAAPVRSKAQVGVQGNLTITAGAGQRTWYGSLSIDAGSGDYSLPASSLTIATPVACTRDDDCASGYCGNGQCGAAPPRVAITGVSDGEVTNSIPVSVCYTAADPMLAGVEGTLDGIDFTECVVVSAEGVHSVSLIARSLLGATSSAQTRFTIDLTPPFVAVDASTPAVTSAGTVDLVIEAHDRAGPLRSVAVNGSVLSAASDGLYHHVSTLGEGANVFGIVATDLAGNESTLLPVVIRDTSPPSLVASTPADGAFVRGDVTISGSVSDASATALAINGSAVTVAADGSFTGALHLPDGNHTITIRATDAAANESSIVRQVYVDTVSPQVSITGITDGEVTKTLPVEVCYAATDAYLRSDEGTLDGVPFRGCAHAVTTGVHVLIVTATDFAGNVGTVRARFTIDTTPPAVRVISPSAGETVSMDVPVVAWATDDSGVAELRANDDILAPVVDGPYRGTLRVATGTNVVRVTATDRAGNSSTVDVPVHVRGGTPLTLSLTAPAPAFLVSSPAISVQGRVDGAVDPVFVSVNGVAVTLEADGTFATMANVVVGDAAVVVEARDESGAVASSVVRGARIDANGAVTGPSASAPAAPAGSLHYLHDLAGNLTHVVDTSFDVNNCGYLGVRCPEVSSGGAACAQGLCGAWASDGQFIDIWSDPANCGSPHVTCSAPPLDSTGMPTGAATCTQGVCGITCRRGYVPNEFACIDLAFDPNHCGRPENACADGAACMSGSCSRPGHPVVTRVNGVAAPGAVFRAPLMTGIRLEGIALDSITSVELEDCGPDEGPVLDELCVALPYHVASRASETSLVIPQAVLDHLASADRNPFEIHKWYKLRLGWNENGLEYVDEIGVAVSVDDHETALAPPIITGVSALEVRYGAAYDPATGFLRLGTDPTLRPPVAVLAVGDPLHTELPVYAVTHTGVFLQAGLQGGVVRRVFPGGTETPDAREVTLVYAYSESTLDPVNLASAAPGTPLNCRQAAFLPQVGGLILRGANLYSDGALTVSNPVGTRLPGDLGPPVFLEDRIVIRPAHDSINRPEFEPKWIPIAGVSRSEGFVELSSPRGNAATPWPIHWMDVPVIESAGPQWFVTYDQVMTLTGQFFTKVTDVSFTWAGLKEHLTRAVASPPKPEQFYVVDENHIEIALSSAGGIIPRHLAAVCTRAGPFVDEFPGTRSFAITNAAGTGTVPLDAVDRSGTPIVVPIPRCPSMETSAGGGLMPGGSPSPAEPDLPAIVITIGSGPVGPTSGDLTGR